MVLDKITTTYICIHLAYIYLESKIIPVSKTESTSNLTADGAMLPNWAYNASFRCIARR